MMTVHSCVCFNSQTRIKADFAADFAAGFSGFFFFCCFPLYATNGAPRPRPLNVTHTMFHKSQNRSCSHHLLFTRQITSSPHPRYTNMRII